jgi:hypothetical protein
MRWVGHVALMREKRNVYRMMVEKPEVKRPLGTRRREWKNDIKMDLREEEAVCTGFIWLRIGASGGFM